MKEADWLTCTDPQVMLRFLRPGPEERRLYRGMSSQERKWRLRGPGERKLRLFGVACCRLMVHAMREEHNTKAVDVAERLADGLVTKAQVRDVDGRHGPGPYFQLHSACECVLRKNAFLAASSGSEDAARADADVTEGRWYNGSPPPAWQQVHLAALAAQACLLRDIFRYPSRSQLGIPLELLAWEDATVRRIANKVYAERSFGDLPILADALEEAGCTNSDILDHLRGPGPHVRGCWPVDLCLGLP